MALAVLVVDDVESNRMIARELLESVGHQVSIAESGRQALALMREYAFDAVLSDVWMPEMDGTQLLEHLRRDYSPEALTIVMTSAHFSQQQQDTLLAMGASVCLPKPHSPEALFTAIQGRTPDCSKLPPTPPKLDNETSAKIHALYHHQLQEDIARIQQALALKDKESIRIAAHRIVSASRALGLERQADAALQIETYDEDQAKPNWESFTLLITRQINQLTDGMEQP